MIGMDVGRGLKARAGREDNGAGTERHEGGWSQGWRGRRRCGRGRTGRGEGVLTGEPGR